eukprot:9410735-Lingulodinium_polyedra.AAC.1
MLCHVVLDTGLALKWLQPAACASQASEHSCSGLRTYSDAGRREDEHSAACAWLLVRVTSETVETILAAGAWLEPWGPETSITELELRAAAGATEALWQVTRGKVPSLGFSSSQPGFVPEAQTLE